MSKALCGSSVFISLPPEDEQPLIRMKINKERPNMIIFFEFKYIVLNYLDLMVKKSTVATAETVTSSAGNKKDSKAFA